MSEQYIIEPLINKKLLLSKSDNIDINILKPIFERNIQDCKYKDEGLGNGYYSIIKFNNDCIRLYYRGCSIKPFSGDSYNHEATFYSESSDGLNFERKNNHMLFKNGCSHNFFPFLFDNKLYGIGGTSNSIGGLKLLKYDNQWNIVKNFVSDKDILVTPHGNNYDSLNLVIFNPNDNLYWVYLRHNLKTGRSAQYSTTSDLINFTEFKRMNFNSYDGQIYTTNVCVYPNSKTLIAFPTVHFQENNYYKKSAFAFSNNGSDWDFIDFNICNIQDSHMMCQGIIESEIMRKIFCYPYFLKEGILKCYSWDFHRIQEIKCNSVGTILFGPFKLKTNIIKINCNTNEDGYIKVYLYEEEKMISESKLIQGNHYFKNIKWLSKFLIEPTKNYNIGFELIKSSLYSLSFE